jgi:transcriptional regulator with XRE-family HTH domain
MLREAVGWTIMKAAADLGVSRLTYRNWETGKVNPRPDHLRAYAAQLNVFLYATKNINP